MVGMCWAHSGLSGKLLGIHWESQESTGSPLGTVAEWKLLHQLPPNILEGAKFGLKNDTTVG